MEHDIADKCKHIAKSSFKNCKFTQNLQQINEIMGSPSSIEKFQEDDRKKYMNYKL